MSTVPIADPNRGFKTWNITEIYSGPDGLGRFVPNLQDLVVDFSRGFFIVTDVNVTTSISELSSWVIPQQNELTDTDILLGVGPGRQSESYRMYIDKSVTPYTLDVDSRLHIYRVDAAYVKIFKGTDISINGTVISSMYNQNGEFDSENVPLVMLTQAEGTNKGIHTIASAKTNYDLEDGEVVTVVIYSDTGARIGINTLLTKNSTFIRRLEAGKKYIDRVELESPFISTTEPDTLRAPANVPQDSLSLTARIWYTDGTSTRRAIDGSKVRLYGLQGALTTVPGTTWDLTLVYVLGQEESAINATTNGSHQYGHVATSYRLQTTASLSEYTVKLFVVPTWRNETEGWGLEYYLYDLDRGTYYYATDDVVPGLNAASFQPKLYGVDQELVVTLNLRDVSATLADFRYSQTFTVALMANGTTDSTGFFLRYTTAQSKTYGANLSARISNLGGGDWSIDLTNGEEILSSWIDRLYTPIMPLYDPLTEAGPLVPTHFIMSINGFNTEYPISEWDNALISNTAGTPGMSIALHWIRKVNSINLHLGVSPLKIVHLN